MAAAASELAADWEPVGRSSNPGMTEAHEEALMASAWALGESGKIRQKADPATKALWKRRTCQAKGTANIRDFMLPRLRD